MEDTNRAWRERECPSVSLVYALRSTARAMVAYQRHLAGVIGRNMDLSLRNLLPYLISRRTYERRHCLHVGMFYGLAMEKISFLVSGALNSRVLLNYDNFMYFLTQVPPSTANVLSSTATPIMFMLRPLEIEDLRLQSSEPLLRKRTPLTQMSNQIAQVITSIYSAQALSIILITLSTNSTDPANTDQSANHN